MEWVMLGDNKGSAKLEAFYDSWEALSEFSDVISKMGMGSGKNISPEQFCDILLSLGFVDRTETCRNSSLSDELRLHNFTKELRQLCKEHGAKIYGSADDSFSVKVGEISDNLFIPEKS